MDPIFRRFVRRALTVRSYIPLTLLLFTGDVLPLQAQNPAQDTVRISLIRAEQMFLDSNLMLLAQKYSVDAQKALVIQARLYPNPNLSYSRGPVIPIRDPNAQYPYSDFSTNSENAANLSQVILLAGKRNKNVRLAHANADLAEYQLFDLIRTLKYTLRTDFFNIHYLQQSARVYQAEIKALQQIANAFASEQSKGYIAEKEVLRIRAQLYSFQGEYTSLLSQIRDLQSELKLVLRVPARIYLVPEPDTVLVAGLSPGRYPLKSLLDSAYKNRTDLLIARENAEVSKLTYRYQKALAVPDLSLNIGWDHQGSYARDYNYAGVAIDLPFFNRNQGNIKMAKIMIDNSETLRRNTEATVEENVTTALEAAFEKNQLVQSIDPKFTTDFERLMREVFLSYQKRNMTLLEFLDFYDAFKQNATQLNSLKYQRIQAFEDLNFYTATHFYN